MLLTLDGILVLKWIMKIIAMLKDWIDKMLLKK